ncbi:MAG: low specificity L-threonine aldolase [Clostridia bacterium]|nr:low specificity L-threonine aldolase [Clostridia bacterium]
MILFVNDYQEGCLPEILQKLTCFNMQSNVGYGLDGHCENAISIIKSMVKTQCDVHFIAGGTLTNKTVISEFLKSYQGVICADSSHIAMHETGAIENGGHKVLTLPSVNGKLAAEDVESCVKGYIGGQMREHTVMPGMVYISQSTEVGTVYTLNEIKKLSAVCKKYGLYFYIDGARILYSLFAKSCDYTLSDISSYCDVFYIGGTKAGAMFGEALVINNDSLKANFRSVLKQNGALLAKGSLLGIQFEGLLENENYKKYCKSAVENSNRIRSALKAKNIALEIESEDTQTFAIFTNEQYAKLEKQFNFGEVTRLNGNVHARICTSWATSVESVNALEKAIENL